MQFDFKNGGAYKLKSDLIGYKKAYCSPRDYWRSDFKKAILTLRVPGGQTVVVPDSDHKYDCIEETDVNGIMKTDKVYVQKIEDLDGKPISDDFICTSSRSHGPQIPVNFDSNGVVIGHDYLSEWSGYVHRYKFGGKYESDLDLNHKNIFGNGYFFYSTKEQAKKSNEYY
ncbi:hypothetical protein QLL95_gp0392 [Cotonvirus japonicus]|uniref:Uncharacterized protein n=1 Tax=Cotonvirus japonicus TaxID=2811091 RepID=A0ABM7NUI3_9VIRU|nr:hypothetical protein QLL95_gp0392 [Cotonvirus japonicus]BCS83731.1 hypothetical protein [Cotonvirus japonicus]